jgi:salicylate hydroxylase
MGSTPPPLVRIAIIGGGIAGLALAAGLSRHPHIDAHVYESVPAYADVGAGLALHRNALAAMALIHPDVPSMYFARALSMGREEHEEMVTEVRLAHGPHAGDLVAELGRARGRKTIARAELLRGLRGLVPDGRLHLGKRLRGLEQGARGAVKVSFEDGEELCVDGVVGADGLRSATRSYILGPDHPAAPPRNPEGWQIYRRMMTMEQARAEGIAEKWTRDVGIFMGPKGHLNALPLDKGTKLNVGIAVRGAKVGVDGKPAALDVRDYEDYSDEARGLVRMVAKDVNMMWTAADHDPAPTFCRGRVCMIGDAVSPGYPWPPSPTYQTD